MGVLRDTSNKFYVDVNSNPGVWTEFYTELDAEIVRATFVALAPFDTYLEAQNFADKLRAMDNIDEWVAQSNPNFDDMSFRWLLDLESTSILYLHAKIRHLERKLDELFGENLHLGELLHQAIDGDSGWDELGFGDDFDPGEGGVPCRFVPQPPRLSPGYRREPPAPDPE